MSDLNNQNKLTRKIINVGIVFSVLSSTLVAYAGLIANFSVDVSGTFLSEQTGGILCSEDVELIGEVHVLIAATEDGSGRLHIQQHVQPQGLIGIGVISGATYHGVGVTHASNNGECIVDALPGACSFVDRTLLISTDKTYPSLFLTGNFHVAIDGNGNVQGDFERFDVTCKAKGS